MTDIPTEEFDCHEDGGIEVEVQGSGSPKQICNGAEGSPWTDGGTLPPGATLTGGWSFNTVKAAGQANVAISFPIQLKEVLEEAEVHYQGKPGFSTFCTGGVEEPTAASGHLCVYEGFLSGATVFGITDLFQSGVFQANPGGASLIFNLTGAEPTSPSTGYGSWAVTGF